MKQYDFEAYRDYGANTSQVRKKSMSEDRNQNGTQEEICYVCRRPESKAGKMVHMPGNLCICNDCMQRAFDQVGQNGFPYGMNFFGGFPGAELFQEQEAPKKQHEKKTESVPAIDIKSIPAPHKIYAKLND